MIGATHIYAASFGSITPYCNRTTPNLMAMALCCKPCLLLSFLFLLVFVHGFFQLLFLFSVIIKLSILVSSFAVDFLCGIGCSAGDLGNFEKVFGFLKRTCL